MPHCVNEDGNVYLCCIKYCACWICSGFPLIVIIRSFISGLASSIFMSAPDRFLQGKKGQILGRVLLNKFYFRQPPFFSECVFFEAGRASSSPKPSVIKSRSSPRLSRDSRFEVPKRIPFYQLPGDTPRMGLGTRQARIFGAKVQKSWILFFGSLLFSVCGNLLFCSVLNSKGFWSSEEHTLKFVFYTIHVKP